MLIRLSLENWMSFRDETSFTMIATRERQHGKRVSRIRKYQTRVLPIAALYGGNASGKTNLCQALQFIQSMVLQGTVPDEPIPVAPFQLNSTSEQQPSCFCLELLTEETLYEFSFSVSRQRILSERLVEIKSSSERTLYDRRENGPNFHPDFQEDQFLAFAFRGTRANQLFLTNAISQNVNNFRPVYDWFANSLVIVNPNAVFVPIQRFLDENDPLHAQMNNILPQLDTGIFRLGGQDVPPEFFESLPVNLQETLKEGDTARIMSEFVVTRKKGKLIVKKLATYHLRDDGTEAQFDITQEADGSKRLIDLLPAFVQLGTTKSRTVVVIDEIDRSLHTLLTRKLIEAYLETCSAHSRAQLLLTTHDLLLMDQRLLRRDEMWIAERDATGASHLIPFSDYQEAKNDKDIRKSYLQGRMGGLPQLWLDGEDLILPASEVEESSN